MPVPADGYSANAVNLQTPFYILVRYTDYLLKFVHDYKYSHRLRMFKNRRMEKITKLAASMSCTHCGILFG
jgi:hypothetical protein